MRFNEIDNTDKIDELLKKYFKITGEYSIVNGRVDVDGDCKLTAKCIKLPVKFNKVSGNFNCSSNQLTTLQGGPTSVGEGFYCSNNQLTTLKGAPQSVGGEFYCRYDSNLPLLRLLFIKNLKLIRINNAPEDVVNYLNKYIGKGPGGALACAAELIKAGFNRNARR